MIRVNQEMFLNALKKMENSNYEVPKVTESYDIDETIMIIGTHEIITSF